MQPGEDNDVVAGCEPIERLCHGLIHLEPGVWRAFGTLFRCLLSTLEGRSDHANRVYPTPRARLIVDLSGTEVVEGRIGSALHLQRGYLSFGGRSIAPFYCPLIRPAVFHSLLNSAALERERPCLRCFAMG